MRDFIVVAKFTAKEMLKRKSFLISNLIILLLIVVGFNVPNIIEKFKGTDEIEAEKILIVDKDNLYGESLQSINEIGLETKFEFKNEEVSIETAKKLVQEENYNGVILIDNLGERPYFQYVVETVTNSAEIEQLTQILDSAYTNLKLMNMGLTQEQLIEINEHVEMQVIQIEEDNFPMTLITMFASIVLFYAIYFCAYQVSTSITTEKTSKIMETLVTSCKPRTIVLGKTAGIGVVGLLQVIAIIVTAVISYKLFLPENILEGIFDISKITPQFIFVVLVYFILGYILYALLYALTGSTVSKPEDVQSANSPVAFVAVIGFYLAYFSMMNPESSLNKFASILPVSSPFSMPFRFVNEGNVWGDFAISIGVLVLTIVLVAKIAIKIYSSAILHYGTKLSLKDLFNFYKQK